MNIKETFDDFYSIMRMDVEVPEHSRYIKFTLEDNTREEILQFKLSHEDYGLLESILSNAKKSY